MRRRVLSLLMAPALLAAQAPVLEAQVPLLDEGRLDPSWFGAAAAFQPSKVLGFQWVKPGLDLSRRSLRLKPWEPAAWLLGPRTLKDQVLLERFERTLVPDLAKGLRRGLRGALPVSQTEGDLLLVGRVVDAVGDGGDTLTFSTASLSYDLKLVDGDTGELLAAFHSTLEGLGADALSLQYAAWCEQLGRLLAGVAAPPTARAVPPPPKPLQPPPAPAFDLEGALRRIEGLKRDGLLSEEEYQRFRKRAADRAK